MTNKVSAGLLVYRRNPQLEVFLVHPGGPFWAKKDEGAWSIPKGEYTQDEDALAAAQREFQEETGQSVEGEFLALTPLKQSSGKLVSAWAVEGEVDATAVRSNLFSMEWPPRSGKQQEFPEIDRGAWFTPEEAQVKINKGQVGFILELLSLLGEN